MTVKGKKKSKKGKAPVSKYAAANGSGSKVRGEEESSDSESNVNHVNGTTNNRKEAPSTTQATITTTAATAAGRPNRNKLDEDMKKVVNRTENCERWMLVTGLPSKGEDDDDTADYNDPVEELTQEQISILRYILITKNRAGQLKKYENRSQIPMMVGGTPRRVMM
jgi:hypothetical protein